MNDFFIEYKLDSYKPVLLYGVSDQYKKILAFCDLVWSEDWLLKKEIYQFNPTVMLYGSPGTGKTTLLRNLAYDLKQQREDFKYYVINIELLLNKDLGQSSKNLSQIFDDIESLVEKEYNVLIHFDDVDSVLCSRYISNESSGVKRLINTFITKLDKIQFNNYKNPPIIATTTNMYSLIDTAVKRRFSVKFMIENDMKPHEFQMWLEPIVQDIGIKESIDYSYLYATMMEKKLTNYDLYLIMQNMFLDKIAGSEVTYQQLILGIKEALSSQEDFTIQKETR